MTKKLQLSDSLRMQLDTWFETRAPITPSINFAVLDRTGVVYHHGVGEFQRDGRAPQLDTIYRIASMSKSFCIVCVLILEERGLLDTSAPVSRYVPEFPDYVDASGAVTPVTVHNLMSNSSGLPEDNAWADSVLGLDRETLRGILAGGLRFAAVPDTLYQYSNLGFATLGLVVENVSGMPFFEFAESEVLRPLGLSSTHYDYTYFVDNGESGAGIAHGYESFDGGESWFERPFGTADAMGCAGSIFSTLPDIARWSAWLSSAFDPTNFDDAILSRARRRTMQRIQTPCHAEERVARDTLVSIGYGLGLVNEIDRDFGNFSQHSGGLPGFNSNMRWHPSSGYGVIVFTNTNGMNSALWATEILTAVMTDVAAPAVEMPLWPETLAAARAIDTMLYTHGSFGDCAALFSGNVLSDKPVDVRDSRTAALIAERGGLVSVEDAGDLTDRMKWAVSGAQLVWSVPCRDGALQARIEMTELADTRIQRVEVEAPYDPATGEPDIVVHRFRPVLL